MWKFRQISTVGSVVTKALDAETEAKTEAVYLKTEAQGSWPIITVLSSIQLRKIKLNHDWCYSHDGHALQCIYAILTTV